MNKHSMLDTHVSSVEKLHQNQIYPIVILIKFKSIKQMKEVKDPRYQVEQLHQKDAKNIYEHTMKQEQEYKHLISEVIHAGANLMLICAQVAAKIEQEQQRPIWIPSGTIWWQLRFDLKLLFNKYLINIIYAPCHESFVFKEKWTNPRGSENDIQKATDPRGFVHYIYYGRILFTIELCSSK